LCRKKYYPFILSHILPSCQYFFKIFLNFYNGFLNFYSVKVEIASLALAMTSEPLGRVGWRKPLLRCHSGVRRKPKR